ncbi:TRAP transporter small permease [Arsenicitalea aurantiaca]|nr:TRAP transporter small permease [Arsenicitalea aurantiaca]
MRRAFRLLDRSIEFLVFACFLAIVLVGTAQVFNRYVLNLSLSWSEEFQRYGHVWLVFLGIPVAYRRGMHIGMETLAGGLSARGKRIFQFVIDLLWCALALALLIGLGQLMQFLNFQRSPGMRLPMPYAYGGILIGAGYMLLIGLRRIVDNLRGLPPESDEYSGQVTP